MFYRLRYLPKHDERKRVREVGRRETKLGHKLVVWWSLWEGNTNFQEKITNKNQTNRTQLNNRIVCAFDEKCVSPTVMVRNFTNKSNRDYIFRFRSDFYT